MCNFQRSPPRNCNRHAKPVLFSKRSANLGLDLIAFTLKSQNETVSHRIRIGQALIARRRVLVRIMLLLGLVLCNMNAKISEIAKTNCLKAWELYFYACDRVHFYQALFVYFFVKMKVQKR